MKRTPAIKSLPEAITFYLDDCIARGMTPNTLVTKTRSLDRFYRWCTSEGVDLLSEINLEVMEGFRVYLHHYKKQRDGKPLSINSQHKFLTDVKLFLRRLYQRKIIYNSSFESFEMPRCQKRLPRSVLSKVEVELIFRMPMLRGDNKGIRDRAILELYYASAIRRSELVRLTIDNLDLSARIIFIIEAKGMKDRWIPISQRACEWIDRYISEVRHKHLCLDSEERLFITDEGKPMTSDQVGQMVGKYIRRSGVNKPGACHLFRHSVATSMLDNGADLRYVQELLGHADISTTQIYTHVSIEKLKSVYANTHPAAS